MPEGSGRPPGGGADPEGVEVRLTEEELAGDVPLVSVRTGEPTEALVGVWFARTPRWAWLPLAGLVALAAVRGSWAPLASWWPIAALAVPVVTSRAATGRLPLDRGSIERIARLRARRARVLLAGLLLTWVAVGLWLLGSRAGGLLVLALVLALYGTAAALAAAGRAVGVRGRPADDGGAVLRAAHPAFVDALELHRTGHRP